jgi:hypothetical protein
MEEEIKKEEVEISNKGNVRHRHCPRCKQEIVVNVGLHNWKNLFRMPTFNDWMFLVMLMLVLASAYAYQHDIKACKEFAQNQSINIYNYGQGAMNQLNLSGFDLGTTKENNTICSLNASCTNGQQTG